MTTGSETNEIFRARIAVRSDDLDTNGHVRGPAYLAYADHARWMCVAAAGVDLDHMRAEQKIGPVNLETTIRFHRELKSLEEIEVTCTFIWGDGKTSRIEQEIRTREGALAAEIKSTCGLLDLTNRHLIPDPAHHWHQAATHPERLGLK